MPNIERDRTPADIARRIPLFPLEGAILLPRATLPLQIFEPRYLAMIDDALRGDRIVGIIQPLGEGGVTGSPTGRTPLKRIGCAGRITAFQEIDGGERLLISLVGITRFELGREIEAGKPYRECEILTERFAADRAPVAAGDGQATTGQATTTRATIDRARLLDTLQRFLASRQMQADWTKIEKMDSETLVNALAMASPFGAEEKQALLEAETLAARAEVLITLAEIDLASGHSGAGGGSRLQ